MSENQQRPGGLSDAAAQAREQIEAALTTLVEHAAHESASAVAKALAARDQEAAEATSASLAALRTSLEQERADGERAWADRLADQRRELECVEAELTTLKASADEQAACVAAAEEARREADAALQAVTTQHAAERQTVVEVVARLLGHVQDLDAARSLREVLDVLAVALAPEVARAALFVVRGDELHAWRFVGLGEAAPDPATVVVPFAQAGELARATSSRIALEVRKNDGAEAHPALAFLELEPGQVGMAAPLVVGDRTVALAYADSISASGRPVSPVWPEVVELLARHASRCLSTITAERASQRVAPAARPQAQWTDAPDAREEAVAARLSSAS